MDLESSSWTDQTLNPVSPSFLLENLCPAVEARDEGWDNGWHINYSTMGSGMQYLFFYRQICSHLLKNSPGEASESASKTLLHPQMWVSSKSKFVRVEFSLRHSTEFSLRHSAKAWQEKVGHRVQLLNQSNSGYSQSYRPSREILWLLNQWMRDETSWNMDYGTKISGMQYDLSKHQVCLQTVLKSLGICWY